MKNSFWTQGVSIWASRPTASGYISSFSVPGWAFMLIGLLIILNVLAWGFIGLYEAVRVVV